MSYDLIVAGGTLVTPDGALTAHLLVRDGRIAGITNGGADELPPARQVLDVRGLYVLPGLIDAHVHFRDPGATDKEDWASGSAAAACGGFTTVFDMPNTSPPTAGEGVELIRRAREWGVDMTAETCPQYLFLDVTDPAVARWGSRARVNPPLRHRWHNERLWGGLRDGTLQMIASDHAPHLPADKEKESIWDAAAGMPGVETTLYLLLTEVNSGRITLSDVARWLSEAPARTWGIFPRKGAQRVGSDADFTVVDLDRQGVIRADRMHGKVRFTPYEGRPYRGAPVYTVVRGRVVAAGGEMVGEPGGRWVKPGGSP